MTRAIEELLTLKDEKPRCQAAGCRRNATAAITLSHPRWKRPEHADLCDKHVDAFVTAAKARGIEVDRS